MQNTNAKKLFAEKIDACYKEYKTGWLQLSKEEIIGKVEEIEAVTRIAKTLPEQVTDEAAEYLLRFKNPLEVVSDEWINRNGMDALVIDDEMEHILWELLDKKYAEMNYAMETEDDPDDGIRDEQDWQVKTGPVLSM